MTTALLSGLQLREYQEEALDAVAAAEARGVRRQLGVAATGLGKTVIFTALAQRRGGRTLILAHRDELISQAAAKVLEVWPGADVGVVKAERDEHSAQVVVASVQTLARGNRLERMVGDPGSVFSGFLDPDPFGLVVVDEAHHATADSYRKILDRLRAGEDDGPLLLGVTATPQRGDGKGLDGLFTEVVFTRDMLWGIREGYLSDLRGLRLRLDMDMGKVRVSHGDYDQGQAGALLHDAGAPTLIVKAWKRHATGRRTLVFTPTVALAQECAEAFQAEGIRAGFVSGETPVDERRALLAQFSSGALEVMVNCAVLTEGYDEPRVDCVVVARPTRSQALYVQMVGRGTRRHPDKADCLVLDVAGASDVHSLVTLPSLFGLDESTVKRMEREGVGAAQGLSDQMEAAALAGRIRAEEANLWRMVRRDGLAWVQVHRDGADRRLFVLRGKVAKMVLAQQEDGTFSATLVRDGQLERQLISGVTMELAQGVAEDYVRKRADRGTAALTATDAPWRKRAPTAKQLHAARKWHLAVDPSWTSGDVADALTAKMERAQARKATKAG